MNKMTYLINSSNGETIFLFDWLYDTELGKNINLTISPNCAPVYTTVEVVDIENDHFDYQKRLVTRRIRVYSKVLTKI